ncbi:MAG: lipoprotein-releasing ABC transporter permease subunit [Candidatus Pelagadaptatus aseana]|uniref:lipoprotein-releasing ABC transporter permease subunit n=1 Tax=Candidatus Pelagadaptatus aseana TaxID=3120508 RepID=UPI0039B2D324
MKAFTRFIGLRYTGSKSSSQLVSFISAISIAGLGLGVGLLLTVLSVMNGFERELEQKILGVLPHGALYHRYGIEDWHSLQTDINRHPNLIASAPFVELQGMLSKGKKVVPTAIFGIDVQQESQVSDLSQYISSTQQKQFAENPESILLGRGIANSLSLEVGDRIQLIIPSQSDHRAAPKFKAVTLAGLIQSNTELDHSLALLHLEAASALSAFPGRVSGLRVKSMDLFSAPETLYQLSRELPYGYYFSDWTRTHGNLYHAIQMSKNLVGLLLFLIVAIAAFNVVSTLVMVVVDKRADIAILKTLGASRSDILAVFMVQGSMIGVIGTVIGLVLGFLGSLSAQSLVQFLESALGITFLDSAIYPINYIPSEIWLSDFITVGIASLLLGLTATIYPAWLASRTEPSEALRFEI